jgi:hypothetical protein
LSVIGRIAAITNTSVILDIAAVHDVAYGY